MTHMTVRLLAVAGLLLGALAVASPASADSVWFQSVARASASASCPDDSFGTPWQSNWNAAERSWRPSWAWWPNGGTGGFTCDRQITWAKNGYPVGFCQGADTAYYQFNGGWSIDGITGFVGTTVYSDANCTSGTPAGYLQAVYAPSGFSAQELCGEAFATVGTPIDEGGGVYVCRGVV